MIECVEEFTVIYNITKLDYAEELKGIEEAIHSKKYIKNGIKSGK